MGGCYNRKTELKKDKQIEDIVNGKEEIDRIFEKLFPSEEKEEEEKDGNQLTKEDFVRLSSCLDNLEYLQYFFLQLVLKKFLLPFYELLFAIFYHQ